MQNNESWLITGCRLYFSLQRGLIQFSDFETIINNNYNNYNTCYITQVQMLFTATDRTEN